MKNICQKIVCLMLILIIISSANSAFAVTAEEQQLKAQQQENEDKKKEAEAQKQEVQKTKDTTQKEVDTLNSQIQDYQTQINELDNKIADANQKIQDSNTKLEKAQNNYEEQQKNLETRIVALYESGDTSYLDILLSSESLTDFISSYYIISQLTDIDENLLNDLETKKKTINLSKQKLENEKKEMATILENQTRTTRTLQNTKKLRESFLERLSDQEQETQQQIDEYNKQYEEINRQIIALVANGIDSNYIGGTLAWPVPGYTKITSEYAMRVHPITGVYKLHTGVDISAPMGANFISANDGIVVKAEMNSAYGNMVIIDHGGGISTLYAHGSEILVTVGQSVKRGDAILKVGSTGYSTGPHAHFEVRINGVTTNPLPYITNGLVPGEENTSNQNTTNQNTTN